MFLRLLPVDVYYNFFAKRHKQQQAVKHAREYSVLYNIISLGYPKAKDPSSIHSGHGTFKNTPEASAVFVFHNYCIWTFFRSAAGDGPSCCCC
jgi:hypothetical protein